MEHQWEAWAIEQWNEERYAYRAWPLTIIDSRGLNKRWIFLAAPGCGDAMIPEEGEKCKMKLASRTSVQIPRVTGQRDQTPNFSEHITGEAVRIENPCAAWGIADEHWEKCLASEVVANLRGLKPIVDLNKLRASRLIPRQTDVHHHFVGFELRTSTSAKDAELGALSQLMRMRSDSKDTDHDRLTAFKYMVMGNGGPWSFERSLFESFPHMASMLNNGPGLPARLLDMIRGLDPQQKAASETLFRQSVLTGFAL